MNDANWKQFALLLHRIVTMPLATWELKRDMLLEQLEEFDAKNDMSEIYSWLASKWE